MEKLNSGMKIQHHLKLYRVNYDENFVLASNIKEAGEIFAQINDMTIDQIDTITYEGMLLNNPSNNNNESVLSLLQ